MSLFAPSSPGLSHISHVSTRDASFISDHTTVGHIEDPDRISTRVFNRTQYLSPQFVDKYDISSIIDALKHPNDRHLKNIMVDKKESDEVVQGLARLKPRKMRNHMLKKPNIIVKVNSMRKAG